MTERGSCVGSRSPRSDPPRQSPSSPPTSLLASPLAAPTPPPTTNSTSPSTRTTPLYNVHQLFPALTTLPPVHPPLPLQYLLLIALPPPLRHPHRFAAFAHHLSHLFLLPLSQSTPILTALKGLSVETLSVYNNGSKILIHVNCKSLYSSLLKRAVAISSWLALLASALPAGGDDDDLHKKVSHLTRDMRLAQFRVPSLCCLFLKLKYLIHLKEKEKPTSLRHINTSLCYISNS